MSQDYKLSQEEINKTLLLSPYSLSDSPRDWGLKAKEIKKYFYQFITYFAQRLNLKLEDISKALCELDLKDIQLVEAIEYSLSAHDSSQLSHSKLFGQIRETLLGIFSTIEKHEESTESHSGTINEKIEAHSLSQTSHVDIRRSLSELYALAQNAYALAQGKSRIVPLCDVYELLDILENQEQSPGDVFIFEEKLVPDFVFYKKLNPSEIEQELQNGAVILDYDSYALGQVELVPGQVIICYDKKLVGTESGVDLSRLATKERVEALHSRQEELQTQIELGITDLLLLIDKKEDKRVIVYPSGAFTLENLHEYRLNAVSSLEFSLPVTQGDFESLISFASGGEPTVFIQPQELIMTGDDCQNGTLIPVANRIYEISIRKLMGIYIGKVSCVDYEVF